MEESLLHRFIKGDEDAFSEIYTLYIDTMYTYGISLSFDKSRVEDAIQDVFYQLYQNKSKLSQQINIKYYLLCSLKHKMLDYCKKDRFLSFTDTVSSLDFNIKLSIEDEFIDEEDRKMIDSRINEYFKCLTNQQREAIYLRYIQELEYEEIARILNCNKDYARKLVSRSIEKIKQNYSFFIFVILLYEKYRC